MTVDKFLIIFWPMPEGQAMWTTSQATDFHTDNYRLTRRFFPHSLGLWHLLTPFDSCFLRRITGSGSVVLESSDPKIKWDGPSDGGVLRNVVPKRRPWAETEWPMQVDAKKLSVLLFFGSHSDDDDLSQMARGLSKEGFCHRNVRKMLRLLRWAAKKMHRLEEKVCSIFG